MTYANMDEPSAQVSLEIVGALPAGLDQRLADHLRPHFGGELNDEAVRGLRAQIGLRNVPDYLSSWAVFNYLYYPSNFLKSYLCAKFVSPNIDGTDLVVLDIGCGGGASTAGFVSGLLEQSLGFSRVIGVDQNRQQLEVFDSVTKPWMENRLSCVVQSFQEDMMEYCRGMDFVPHIVLVSYALSELGGVEQVELLELLKRQFVDKGAMVLVLDSDKQGRGIDLQIIGGARVLVPYSNVIFGAPFLEELGLQGRPKFTESKVGNAVANRYFDAWRSHDISAVKDLFWEDCEYHINAERKLLGVNELLSYWRYNSSRQSDVLTRFKILSESSAGLIIEWHASFNRSDTKDIRILDGVMILEVVHGRIKKLREFYCQKHVGSFA